MREIDALKKETYRIVLNGRKSAEGLQVTSEGVVYGIVRGDGGRYRELFARLGVSEGDWVVCIPDGVVVERPFFVEYEDSMAEGKHGVAMLGKDARATLFGVAEKIEDERSEIVREIFVGAGATLQLQELYAPGADRILVSETRSVVGNGGRMETVFAVLGEGNSNVSYVTDLAEPNAGSTLYGLFMAASSENVGIGVRIDHSVSDCRSEALIKGIASGNARGEFKGHVYVAPDAQRTEAYQQSRNLVLNDTARITTMPQLEIYADDVRCSHGATVGQLDADAIYYMRQRGLSLDEARRLQMTGFVNDIISRCGEGHFSEEVRSLAAAKIEKL